MTEFTIDSKIINGDVAIVKVAGFLDAYTFEQMEHKINSLFNEGFYKVIVDLESVDYISSAGAGVFIGGLANARENGGNIILLNPTAGVREVFDLLGLSAIFTIANDQSAALSAF